ncbi:MAG: hypothetical protein K6L76_04610 [Agarilytica sp.]
MTSELEVTVRLLSLSKMQGIVLSKEIDGATYRPHSSNDRYVGCIPLREEFSHDILNFIERQKISNSDVDILLSAVSEKYSDVIPVPEQVNNFLKLSDFKLTMSFSCLPE